MHWQQLLTLSLGLFIGQVLPPQPPEKKPAAAPPTEVSGHDLDYWIKLIPSKDQSKSEHAMQMVLAFGPDKASLAVPAILDRLRKHSPSSPVDASVRVNGVIALGVILGGYREADHKTIKDAVALLKRFLTDNQANVRYRAVQALGSIGPDAKEAIPEVIGVIRDPTTWATRQAAVQTLGQIAYDRVNGPSQTVLNAIYGALNDGSIQVRLAAIQAITALGSPVNPVLRQSLVRTLEPLTNKDAEPTVRIGAQMAIMNLTGIDKERVDAIAGLLKSPDPIVRVEVLHTLGTLGKEAKTTVPLLAKCLQDRDATVVAWSIWALAQMGPSATPALPALERIKMDRTQEENLRKLAENAMMQISGKR